MTHKAGVLGSPIAHSLSPVLHMAAYQALGLRDWTYNRTEVTAVELVDYVKGLDDSWRGLSLTMPLKEEAFRVATTVSVQAKLTGSVNTLLRTSTGWIGENTDVHGITRALDEIDLGQSSRVLIIGSGATARSAVSAAVQRGARNVSFMVASQIRPQTLEQTKAMGVISNQCDWGKWPTSFDLVVSTVSHAALIDIVADLPETTHPSVLLDVVYDQGLSPLLQQGKERGYAVIDGTRMLLHQAGEQVRLMTSCQPPIAAMDAALHAELQNRYG